MRAAVSRCSSHTSARWDVYESGELPTENAQSCGPTAMGKGEARAGPKAVVPNEGEENLNERSNIIARDEDGKRDALSGL